MDRVVVKGFFLFLFLFYICTEGFSFLDLQFNPKSIVQMLFYGDEIVQQCNKATSARRELQSKCPSPCRLDKVIEQAGGKITGTTDTTIKTRWVSRPRYRHISLLLWSQPSHSTNIEKQRQLTEECIR